MKFEPSDIPELRPLIRTIVSAVLEELRSENEVLAGQIAFTEAQAAQQLGIPAYVLRDARYRKEISASKVGRGYCYTRSELLAFLRRQAVD